MRKKDLRLADYLEHILWAIQRIHRYTDHLTEAAFMDDESEQVQDAVIRNIEIIGEATRNIECHYPEFIAQHSYIPWKAIYETRNRVSHGYFIIKLEVIWDVVRRDIPALEEQILNVRQALVQTKQAGAGQ